MGHIIGTTAATQNVAFAECKNTLGQKCKSPGAAVGEVIVNSVVSNLGYVVGSKKEKLALESTVKETFKFECSTVTQEVKGGWTVLVGAAQENVLKFVYGFTANETKGVQQVSEFESGGTIFKLTLEAKLLTAGALFERAAIAGTETIVLEEQGKLI